MASEGAEIRDGAILEAWLERLIGGSTARTLLLVVEGERHAGRFHCVFLLTVSTKSESRKYAEQSSDVGGGGGVSGAYRLGPSQTPPLARMLTIQPRLSKATDTSFSVPEIGASQSCTVDVNHKVYPSPIPRYQHNH